MDSLKTSTGELTKHIRVGKGQIVIMAVASYQRWSNILFVPIHVNFACVDSSHFGATMHTSSGHPAGSMEPFPRDRPLVPMRICPSISSFRTSVLDHEYLQSSLFRWSGGVSRVSAASHPVTLKYFLTLVISQMAFCVSGNFLRHSRC
jgi:hypothetical protein